jgi:predicted DNA-binding transcriptional regulator AlpA
MTPKSIHQAPAAIAPEAARTKSVLDVIAHGSGDELLNLRDLKASGSHPFSNSTRRRKIENNEYPSPIKISAQMCLWKAGDIRRWRQDPTGFKQASNTGRA